MILFLSRIEARELLLLWYAGCGVRAGVGGASTKGRWAVHRCKHQARRIHLSLAATLQQASVEGARSVNGVLAREYCMCCRHRTLPEPRQRDFAAAPGRVGGRGPRGGRGGAHGPSAACSARQSSPRRVVRSGARRPGHCRRAPAPRPAARPPLPRSLTTQPPYRTTLPELPTAEPAERLTCSFRGGGNNDNDGFAATVVQN